MRAGYRKAEDGLDWPDDATLITRIRAYVPEQAEVLIRTQETIVADALAQLEPKTLQALGVRIVSGADNPFVTIGDSDVDKIVKAILADAERRIGEADKPVTKKAKAKVKAAA